jgi:hypothetical protein
VVSVQSRLVPPTDIRAPWGIARKRTVQETNAAGLSATLAAPLYGRPLRESLDGTGCLVAVEQGHADTRSGRSASDLAKPTNPSAVLGQKRRLALRLVSNRSIESLP